MIASLLNPLWDRFFSYSLSHPSTQKAIFAKGTGKRSCSELINAFSEKKGDERDEIIKELAHCTLESFGSYYEKTVEDFKKDAKRIVKYRKKPLPFTEEVRSRVTKSVTSCLGSRPSFTRYCKATYSYLKERYFSLFCLSAAVTNQELKYEIGKFIQVIMGSDQIVSTVNTLSTLFKKIGEHCPEKVLTFMKKGFEGIAHLEKYQLLIVVVGVCSIASYFFQMSHDDFGAKVDMLELAKEGAYDHLKEGNFSLLQALKGALFKKEGNGLILPVLVGKKGSGKTALVELFSRNVAKGVGRYSDLGIEQIIYANGSSIQMHVTKEEKTIFDQIKESGKRESTLLFIDELDGLMSDPRGPNLLKTELDQGRVRIVGAVTLEGFGSLKVTDSDGAFIDRFSPIKMEAIDEQSARALAGEVSYPIDEEAYNKVYETASVEDYLNVRRYCQLFQLAENTLEIWSPITLQSSLKEVEQCIDILERELDRALVNSSSEECSKNEDVLEKKIQQKEEIEQEIKKQEGMLEEVVATKKELSQAVKKRDILAHKINSDSYIEQDLVDFVILDRIVIPYLAARKKGAIDAYNSTYPEEQIPTTITKETIETIVKRQDVPIVGACGSSKVYGPHLP